MEDKYLMYVIDRSNKLQDKRRPDKDNHSFANPAADGDATETDFSISGVSTPQERRGYSRATFDRYKPVRIGKERFPADLQSVSGESTPQDRRGYSRVARPLDPFEPPRDQIQNSGASTPQDRRGFARARLDSYEQAHVSGEQLQQMQNSYRMSKGMSNNELFLDEKSVLKKKRMIYVLAGLIAILVLLLIMVIGAIVAIAFLYWRTGIAFIAPSLDEAVSAQQVIRFESDIDSLTQTIDAIEQNVNFTMDVILAVNLQLNHMIELTQNSFSTIDALIGIIDQLNNRTMITRDNLTTVVHQVSTVRNDITTLNSQVPTIDSRLTDVEDDITVLDTSLLNHENLLRSTQSNLTTLQGQTNGLVTSVNNINGRLTTLVNVYQNCREDTSVCNITTLRDTRLFCSTSALLKNLEVSRLITYTLLNGVHFT